MDKILEQIGDIGIVPVIAISEADQAIPLARALMDGGISCAEITFRTEAGVEAIRRISQEMPEMLVGAGTVLTIQQVDEAMKAGAKFMVSPGFNPVVVDYALNRNFPVIPGCATPSEMEQAIGKGLEVIKFFPAEQAGGLPYIKAVSAPYSTLRFMPTGGINIENLKKYLDFPKILACGGSWMVSQELIASGRFDEIRRLCEEAVTYIKQVREGKDE